MPWKDIVGHVRRTWTSTLLRIRGGKPVAPTPAAKWSVPSPPRELHTAEEIRDELSRLLNEDRPGPPLPVLLPLRRQVPPGEDGANWEFQWHESYHGDTCGIRVVLVDVQSRWNLR